MPSYLKSKTLKKSNRSTVAHIAQNESTHTELTLHDKSYARLGVLGAGIYGTTFEVQEPGSNKQHYAFKVQKISPEHRTPNDEYPIWREIDFQQDFVSKLSPTDVQFFIKLYDYEVINNCQHRQKRTKINTIIRPKNKWEQKIYDIDRSPYCAYFLMELVKGVTISEYYQQILQQPGNKVPSRKIIINLAQQFLKCLELLSKAGYAHNDEHFGNLMIEPLDKTNSSILNQPQGFSPDFMLDGKKINKMKYQFKLIDYGLINHRKYKQRVPLQKNQELFIADPEIYYYTIALRVISQFCTNSGICTSIYELAGRKDPQESNAMFDYRLNLLKQIQLHHSKFLSSAISKYSTQYPDINEYLAHVFEFVKTHVTPELLKDPTKPNRPENYYYLSDILGKQSYSKPSHRYLTDFVITKITEEFRARKTKEHLEYSGYELLDPRMLRFLAPKRDYLSVLGFTKLDEVIAWIAKNYTCDSD